MKRLFILTLCCVLLVGCGSNKDSADVSLSDDMSVEEATKYAEVLFKDNVKDSNSKEELLSNMIEDAVNDSVDVGEVVESSTVEEVVTLDATMLDKYIDTLGAGYDEVRSKIGIEELELTHTDANTAWMPPFVMYGVYVNDDYGFEALFDNRSDKWGKAVLKEYEISGTTFYCDVLGTGLDEGLTSEVMAELYGDYITSSNPNNDDRLYKYKDCVLLCECSQDDVYILGIQVMKEEDFKLLRPATAKTFGYDVVEEVETLEWTKNIGNIGFEAEERPMSVRICDRVFTFNHPEQYSMSIQSDEYLKDNLGIYNAKYLMFENETDGKEFRAVLNTKASGNRFLKFASAFYDGVDRLHDSDKSEIVKDSDKFTLFRTKPIKTAASTYDAGYIYLKDYDLYLIVTSLKYDDSESKYIEQAYYISDYFEECVSMVIEDNSSKEELSDSKAEDTTNDSTSAELVESSTEDSSIVTESETPGKVINFVREDCEQIEFELNKVMTLSGNDVVITGVLNSGTINKEDFLAVIYEDGTQKLFGAVSLDEGTSINVGSVTGNGQRIGIHVGKQVEENLLDGMVELKLGTFKFE